MEQKQVTANYLVTKDDLYQFAIAAMKDQDNKVERWCCRLIGLAMVIFGLIGAIFLTTSVFHLSVNCFCRFSSWFILRYTASLFDEKADKSLRK